MYEQKKIALLYTAMYKPLADFRRSFSSGMISVLSYQYIVSQASLLQREVKTSLPMIVNIESVVKGPDPMHK